MYVEQDMEVPKTQMLNQYVLKNEMERNKKKGKPRHLQICVAPCRTPETDSGEINKNMATIRALYKRHAKKKNVKIEFPACCGQGTVQSIEFHHNGINSSDHCRLRQNATKISNWEIGSSVDVHGERYNNN